MNKLDIENIFLDLDGTTLKSDKTISLETLKVLKELKSKNINIFVATGRPSYMIKQELEALEVNHNVVCVNGGMIINSQEKKILHKETIDYISSKKIEDFLKSKKLPYLIYTDQLMFYNCSDDNEWISYLQKRIGSLKNEYQWTLSKIDKNFLLKDHNVVKFLVPTTNLQPELLNDLIQFFKTKITAFKLLKSQKNILDIIPSHSSKGEGIRYIANLLSLNLDKTLAFGDADNDIPMFEAVKYSVAMGNAVDELKNIATYVTDSNNEEGIANFIKTKVL